jgi:hypothetical protein
MMRGGIWARDIGCWWVGGRAGYVWQGRDALVIEIVVKFVVETFDILER